MLMSHELLRHRTIMLRISQMIFFQIGKKNSIQNQIHRSTTDGRTDDVYIYLCIQPLSLLVVDMIRIITIRIRKSDWPNLKIISIY